MRIKICGITQADQGRAIAQLGATALGFICVPASPRYVTADQIRQMVDALASPAVEAELQRLGQGAIGIDANRFPEGTVQPDRIGVFVNASLDTIVSTVQVGGLSGVQLHGQEPAEFCQVLRAALPDIELIKAIRVKTPADLAETTQFAPYVDTFLLDAYHPTLQGGTGKTLNWESLRHFTPDRPWFLAGGLTPDNITEALSTLHPDGIDASSGVENGPGDKNLAAVKRLVDAVRAIAPVHPPECSTTR